MITMAAIYIAGVISGIVLIIIALVGWIHKSAIAVKNRKPNDGKQEHTYTGPTALEDYRANRHRRRRGSSTSVA